MPARRNGQRVAGAAFGARIVRQLRDDLASSYGLPMDEYASEVAYPTLLIVTASVYFKRANGAGITVDDIFTDDDGNLTQWSQPVLG